MHDRACNFVEMLNNMFSIDSMDDLKLKIEI